MSPRERFCAVLNGGLPDDRFPVIEWATWWHLTLDRWETEGLPSKLDGAEIKRFFGLDIDYQLWIPQPNYEIPSKPEGHWIETESDYDALRPHLYPWPPKYSVDYWKDRRREQEAGSAVLWITLNGFFWWPRVLLGIERHLYAFYDQPELMHRINNDQADYMARCLEHLDQAFVPDFMTFAEDMSYNHGPMISKVQFDEFMAPYYRRIIPLLRERGVVVLIDSDGDVEPLIPWFAEVGVQGILPLERMAGVDVNRIRSNHPDWIMIGGFDKTVMPLGEAAMRREFERLMPLMRSSRFIPSVDHQTPPGVSIDNYRIYCRLLCEYARTALEN
jgi:hypothetical protein